MFSLNGVALFVYNLYGYRAVIAAGFCSGYRNIEDFFVVLYGQYSERIREQDIVWTFVAGALSIAATGDGEHQQCQHAHQSVVYLSHCYTYAL